MGMRKFLFFFLTVVFFQVSFGQNIEFIYELVYRPNVDDEITNKEYFSLLYDTDQQQSYFKNITGLEENWASKNEIGFNTQVFKDFKGNKFYLLDKVLSKFYKNEFKRINNWMITNDSKYILNHKTYQAKIASGGRNWVAWYSAEIPFADGPYKFNGLPGLIFEITDTENNYSFKLVQILKSNKNIILPNYTSLNDDDLKKLKKKTLENPSSNLMLAINQMKGNNMGFSVTFDNKNIDEKEMAEQLDKEIKEFNKTFNNPIEIGDVWLK